MYSALSLSLSIHIYTYKKYTYAKLYIHIYRRRLRRVPPAPFFPAGPLQSALLGSPWRKLETGSRNPRKIDPDRLKNRPQKLENRGLEGVWEVLGATFGRKMTWRLSWQILADFGQAREAQNGSKMGELGGKMEPRWSQDGARQGLAGHLEASWGAILGILVSLGADLC